MQLILGSVVRACLVLERPRCPVRVVNVNHDTTQMGATLGRANAQTYDVGHAIHRRLLKVPDPAMSNVPGARVAGRYELIEILGQGRYGIVWKVHDHHRGRDSALKLMFQTGEAEAWREATMLTRLESDHILAVRNADVSVDAPYIETAIAERGTAQSALEPHGLEVTRAVRLTRGMLQGVELCHQRRLLHRDIKPSNVFLAATDDAQIGDFGVAAIMEADGSAAPHGDPDVRAPELFAGGPATATSDVYSAGLTLWAMITGHLPFDYWSDQDPTRHEGEVAKGPPDIRDLAPHVSRTLAKVIRTAIHPDPNLRYATAADFDRALAGLPAVKTTITSVAPHAGHEACWTVRKIKNGQEVNVCHSIDNGHKVDVRRNGTGSRMRPLCSEVTTPAEARVKLRKVFDNLR